MSDKINIIAYAEDEAGRRRLAGLLGDYAFDVLETSKILELTRLLKNNSVSTVVVCQSLGRSEAEELKGLVRTTQPGVEVLFLSSVSDSTGEISMKPADFTHFLRTSVSSRRSLEREIGEFKEFFLSFAERIVQIYGATDRYFSNKDSLVARLSRRTAEKMRLPGDMAGTVYVAALLKDLGMLGIQQQHLEARRRFTEDERIPIKKHVFNTVQILNQVRFPWNVDAIILQHHENYDGSGYPMGLRGRAISIGARIVRIADTYAAMLFERPWRAALTPDEAIREILLDTGSKFDPEVVEAFQSAIDEESAVSGRRVSFLLIDRNQNISPLLKLGANGGNYDIASTDDAMEGLGMLKLRVPDIIVINAEMIEKDYFIHFFNAMYEVPAMQESSYIFILPNADYPRHFKGVNVRYLVQPVEMEEMSAAVGALMGERTGGVEARKTPSGLRGSLDNFSLPDIIQILNMGLKTARIELASEDRWGILHMKSGNVTHASTNEKTGPDALYELMAWKSGEFHIRHGMTIDEENIHTDTMHLLHEGEKRKHKSP